MEAAEREEDSAIDAAIMVGLAGRAYVIGGDFTVTAVRPGSYLAIGLRRNIASGAMFAASGPSPRARLQLALRAAEAHDVHIGPPGRWSKSPGRKNCDQNAVQNARVLTPVREHRSNYDTVVPHRVHRSSTPCTGVR